MTAPEHAKNDDDRDHDAEQPLSDTLLGDPRAGGLAGQGGMVDIKDDLQEDPDTDET